MKTETHYRFLALTRDSLGRGYWANGDTIEEVKKGLKKQGASLKAYAVYEMPEESVNPHVDAMGNISWFWKKGSFLEVGEATLVHSYGMKLKRTKPDPK